MSTDVQILDVGHPDDSTLVSLLDAPLVNWATRYHKDGLKKVLPKARGSKSPIGSWKHLQTDEPTLDEIKARFATVDGADGICAVLDGTGLAVVDIDGSGEQGRRVLADAGVEIPDLCPRVITGSGNDHYWFQTDRPIGRHVKLLHATAASVDVLGQGVVVLPPSLHPETGVAYHWRPPFIDTARLPLLPQRLYELIDESTHPTQPRLAPVDGPILEGERERTLVSALGAARRRGVQEPELRALADAMNARCHPPLGSRDLDRLARSIARYEPDTLDLDALLASVASATPRPTPAQALSFVTPAELMADRQTYLDYVVAPYLIAGTLTDFTGPAKVGKTRLRNYLIRCAVQGVSCLGYPAGLPTKVVLLTEEPITSLMEGLEAAGLTNTRDVVILTRYAARAADWPAMVRAAVAKAREIDARVLMTDTLPGLAGLQGDAENSSGHAIAALRPLQEADAPDLARLVVRHTRKSGGDLVEAGRGSSAFAGEADVLISMSKPKGARPTVRRLEAIGRFEAIPSVLTVERVSGLGSVPNTTDPKGTEPRTDLLVEDYRLVSGADAADPEAASVTDRVAQALPRNSLEAKTVSEMAELMGIPERSVRHGLDDLGSQLRRRGAGTRWDPLKFYIPATPDLKELSGTEPKNNTKGGEAMAIRANQRGPPGQAQRRTRESRDSSKPRHGRTLT
ncbi:MAG TPA: bifunctional DNA primase/polymerase [Armatimonadota bacterium]|nr:bifunctional DNA primase/polymerase [Armatimonadota bacterium]